MSDYVWNSSNSSQSHSYLFQTVESLLKDLPAGSSVLDMGCGNGSFLSRFRNKGWKLAGTDFSVSGIQFAREAFPDIDFFLADAEHAEQDIVRHVGQVDCIISTEVIEHVFDPRAFLKTVHGILKPGGIVVLTTPYHGYLKNLALAVTGKLDSHFTVLWDCGHIKFWSRKTLTQVTSEAGLAPIDFRGSGRIPYLWASMALVAKKPAA
jgi:2-polyprenyl-3-methyl-5-hydroxy-6-metoxy-1,4-benzoquinol methylase